LENSSTAQHELIFVILLYVQGAKTSYLDLCTSKWKSSSMYDNHRRSSGLFTTLMCDLAVELMRYNKYVEFQSWLYDYRKLSLGEFCCSCPKVFNFQPNPTETEITLILRRRGYHPASGGSVYLLPWPLGTWPLCCHCTRQSIKNWTKVTSVTLYRSQVRLNID